MRELLQRLVDWLRRDRLDGELAEEKAFHTRQLEAEGRARGMSPSQAPSRPGVGWEARRGCVSRRGNGGRSPGSTCCTRTCAMGGADSAARRASPPPWS